MDAVALRRYIPHMDRMDNDPLLADLNEPQRRAVMHREGPLLVLAGPGSGKTRVITRRAAYLVRQGVPPWSILAITFTNKAAEEMRHRIAATGVPPGMWVYTFHALGARLLHEFGARVGVQPNFSIYDTADQLAVIKEAMAASNVSDTLIRPETAQAGISRAKNALETPEQLSQKADFFETRSIAQIYSEYQRLLGERNAVDFDDLLTKIAVLLRDHADAQRRLNNRFGYVLIDEYQDTNHAQYVIARALTHERRNICATGDPDQSIYGWRGADLNNILDFERDYPDAVVVRLEQNYRSTGAILRAASRLIKANRRRKHKELWTTNGDGESVRLLEFGEGEDESRHVARTIADLRRGGRNYSDMAIFYRVNALSRGMEEALRDASIPYKIVRGVEFYNRREIRDVLAYLRALVNPDDQNSLVRIINTPARGIGKATVDRLIEASEAAGRTLFETLRMCGTSGEIKPAAAAKVSAFVQKLDQMRPFLAGKVAVAISSVLELSGLEKDIKEQSERGGEEDADRWANVQELISAAVRFDEEYDANVAGGSEVAPGADASEDDAGGATPFDDFFADGSGEATDTSVETVDAARLIAFLRQVALVSDQDAVDQSAGAVLLMTLHAAKGLEFPVVFLIGLEQGLLPHERSLRAGQDVEEERRLCFVGVTRARELLYLSRCERRLVAGMYTSRAASEFLRDLPVDEFERHRFADPLAGARARGGEWDRSDGRRYVETYDHMPAAENRRWGRPTRAEEEDRVVRKAAESGVESRFTGWTAGTMVEHAKYGPGQIVWIRPSAGQTRAAVKFPRVGEKTFILDVAPIRKLARR